MLFADISVMKNTLLITCLLGLLTSTLAQNQKLIDSLSHQLTVLGDDTNKVNYLCALAFEYRNTNPDTAMLIANRAIDLAGKLGFLRGLALAYNHKGILYKNKQQFVESIHWHNESLRTKTQLNDPTGQASSYNNLGRTYGAMNDPVRSIYYYLQSLRIREKQNDTRGMGASYNNMSHAYMNKHEPEKALVFGLKALSYMQLSGDSFELAKVCGHIGFVYYELNQFNNATHYLKRAMLRFKEAGDVIEQSEILVTLGNMLVETKHNQEGLAYLLLAKKTIEQNNLLLSLPSVYISLGQLYGKTNQQPLAIKYALLGMQKSKELKLLEAEKDACEVLSVIYSDHNDYQNALTYYRLFETLKDSVIRHENTLMIEELQTRYQTEKKDLTIKQTSLELDNAVLEINKKRSLLVFSSASFLVLLLLGYLFYSKSVLKQKALFSETLLHQQELRNKAIVEAEEKERIRIARELHDGIGQQLSATKMNLSAFETNLTSLPSAVISKYQDLISLVDDAVKEVRNVSHNMMPNALIRSGLVSAVRDFVNKLSLSEMLKVDLEIVGLNERLENTTETVLYRVLQETVNNIIKHADATQISIQLIKHNDYLNMMVEDNGKGFDPSRLHSFEGIGLKNIVSRIQYLNGSVDFDSSLNRGTTVIINVPI